jgi:hypothetical protein
VFTFVACSGLVSALRSAQLDTQICYGESISDSTVKPLILLVGV